MISLKAMYHQMMDFFIKGGPVMYPIFILSVVGLAIALERWLLLKRRKGDIAKLINEIKPALEKRDLNEAVEICRTKQTSIARVAMAVIETGDGLSRENYEKSAEDSIVTEMPQLEKHVGILGIISSVEPLLGLLGTVTGMIKAFFVIANVNLSNPAELANGIAEALYTTAAGLIVGIPAIAVYNYLLIKIESINWDMEQTAGKVINLLTRK